MNRYMARRRAKIIAAVAAIPLATWLIYLAAFAAWQWARPPVVVKYEYAPAAGGGYDVRADWKYADGAFVMSLDQIGGSDRARVNGSGIGFPARWGWNGVGTMPIGQRIVGVRPVEKADRWLSLKEGDARLLTVLEADGGAELALRVWCVPPELLVQRATGAQTEADAEYARQLRALNDWLAAHAPPDP